MLNIVYCWLCYGIVNENAEKKCYKLIMLKKKNENVNLELIWKHEILENIDEWQEMFKIEISLIMFKVIKSLLGSLEFKP